MQKVRKKRDDKRAISSFQSILANERECFSFASYFNQTDVKWNASSVSICVRSIVMLGDVLIYLVAIQCVILA